MIFLKKILLTTALLFLVSKSNAQTILLDEGFESYQSFSINNFGSWTTLDLDGLTTRTLGGDPAPPTNWVANWPNKYLPQAFQIFQPSAANVTNDATGATGEIRNFDPHSGSKYAGSWAGEMVTSFEGNKDWLISPAITLGSTGNQLSVWVKTLSNSYGDERFRIGVYNGAGNPTSSNDFTIISPNYSPTEPFQYAFSYWTQRTLSLDAFAGQTVKIGIYCLTQQGSMLMVDDFKVTTTGTLNTADFHQKEDVEIYPNPAEHYFKIKSSIEISKVEIFALDGRKILETTKSIVTISDLKAGTYFVKITDKQLNIKTTKIIIT